jgi:hypothetical protein
MRVSFCWLLFTVLWCFAFFTLLITCLFFLGYEPRCCDIHYTYENIHESKEIWKGLPLYLYFC